MEEAPSWRHTMLCRPQTEKDEAEVLQHRLRVEVVAVHVEYFELGGLRATQGLQELANLMGAFGGKGKVERGGEGASEGGIPQSVQPGLGWEEGNHYCTY